jgi:hypothetical protein
VGLVIPHLRSEMLGTPHPGIPANTQWIEMVREIEAAPALYVEGRAFFALGSPSHHGGTLISRMG